MLTRFSLPKAMRRVEGSTALFQNIKPPDILKTPGGSVTWSISSPWVPLSAETVVQQHRVASIHGQRAGDPAVGDAGTTSPSDRLPTMRAPRNRLPLPLTIRLPLVLTRRPRPFAGPAISLPVRSPVPPLGNPLCRGSEDPDKSRQTAANESVHRSASLLRERSTGVTLCLNRPRLMPSAVTSSPVP